MLRTFAFFVALTPLVAAGQALPELAGSRSLGMGGAHRGLGTSNDSLVLNPAGMAAYRRYSMDAFYGQGNLGGLTQMGGSIVDSKSGPVAGGLGFTRVKTEEPDGGPEYGLSRFYMGTGYFVAETLSFGATVRHTRGTIELPNGEREDVRYYSADAGLLLALAQGLSLGVAYNNLLDTDYPTLAPRTLGVGAGWQAGGLTLAADFTRNLNDGEKRENSYALGAEYFAAGAYPLRVGVSRAPYVGRDGKSGDEVCVTGGVGWLNPSGGLDAGFRQSTTREKNWEIAGSLKFFL